MQTDSILHIRWQIHLRHVEKAKENFHRACSVLDEYRTRLKKKKTSPEHNEKYKALQASEKKLNELVASNPEISESSEEFVAAIVEIDNCRKAVETPVITDVEKLNTETLETEVTNSKMAFSLAESELLKFERMFLELDAGKILNDAVSPKILTP